MKLRWIVLTAAIMCCTIPAVALDIKDKTFTTENAGKVVFSHAAHLKKKNAKSPNISCKSCHNDAMQKDVHYTMAQMEKGKSCGQCHNGKQAFSLARCTACHKVKDVIFKVKETGPVVFKHTSHLTKNSQCSVCHNSLFKTGSNPRVSMKAMEKGKSCGACHNGKKSFPLSACTKCHPVREIVFVDKDAGNVTFSHTSHLGMYKCGDCHTRLFATARNRSKVSMQEMESGKSCGACHDGKTGFTVKENCASCHKM
jgi:c(7)-type cytochrome triheme protein